MFDETAQVRAGRSATAAARGPQRRLAELAALAPLDDALRAPPEETAPRGRPGSDTGTGRGGTAAGHGGTAAAPGSGRSGSGDDGPAPPDAVTAPPDGAPVSPDPAASPIDAASPIEAMRSASETAAQDEHAGPLRENPMTAALRGRAGRLVERWVPAGLAGSGRRPSRRLLVSVAAGVVIALGLAGFVLADEPAAEAPPPLPAAQQTSGSASPRPTSASQSATAPSTSGSAAASSGAAGERLVVSVVGKVRRPGLVRMRAGARVADAIESAGGAPRRADLLSVNLARVLVDGEQIYVGVPVPPEVRAGGTADGAQPNGTGTADETGDERVPLNTADQEALESLPGVGEVTAQRILEWRDDHGEFTAVEQLREVDGIGDKRFADLRDAVSIA
ncbi:comEA protein [Prauserella sediminis]|uniref:ComEA protein n=1 Tax=Prauserella sediminis TaxID=577680 RepID=A0A839XFB6_9PSEU|nr:ComEA family DNA-binding protein [Prauserella sediminis]MBB3661107.1 comEA protein [Prauserella sediminis]